MEQYDLMSMLLGAQQSMPQGQGPLLNPRVEIQQKTTQPVLPEPIVAAFSRPKFPTSLDEFNSLIKRQTEGLSSQREGLKDIEGQIAELSKPQGGANIAPFLALSDFFSGTNYLSKYETPQQKEQARKAQALGLKMQLQKSKNELTDKEIDLFKAQYQDAFNREKLAKEEDLLKMKLGADSGKAPELKDWQVQSATYGRRLQQAEDIFSDLEKGGYDRGTFGEGAKDLASKIPGAGHLVSDDLKRQQQAERNFVTAVLRRESGASISAGEFDTAEKMYFPRSGDSPEVVAQKRANRKQVIEGLKLGAGPAWAQLPQISSEIGTGAVMGAPQKTNQAPSFEEWKKQKGIK